MTLHVTPHGIANRMRSPAQAARTCKRGHVGMYKGKNCSECQRMLQRLWRQRNRAWINAYKRAWLKARKAAQ